MHDKMIMVKDYEIAVVKWWLELQCEPVIFD